MPTPDEMRATAREFYARVLDQGDMDYAESVIADDVIEHNPLTPDMPHDKKGALETLRMIHENSPDMKAEIIETIVSGNKMAIRSRFSGTDNGPGWGAPMGAPATGKSFSAEAIDVVTVNDQGQFIEHYGLFDVPGMMMQLGLMPSPPSQG